MTEKRAVCLNCIDGRAQLPVIRWIQDNHNADYVDMITEPGMDGLLAGDGNPIGPILEKLRLSIERNNASPIFVAGHWDCRGNAAADSVHKEQIHSAVGRLKKEFPGAGIIGLWVNKDGKAEKL